MSSDPSRIDAIPTQWSLVRDAHTTGAPQTAAVARQALVLRYAKSVRRYVGGALLTPASLGLLLAAFPPERRTQVVAPHDT